MGTAARQVYQRADNQRKEDGVLADYIFIYTEACEGRKVYPGQGKRQGEGR